MNRLITLVRSVFATGLLALGGLALHSLVSAPVAFAATPCCDITSIAENGRVTARDRATKRVFQFQVNDKALLAKLRIGQQIHADFGTQKVSVDGLAPCCEIAQAAGSKAGAAQVPAVKMPTVMGAQPCCTVVANPALKGRLGRLVVAYPEGANADGTRMGVFKAGEPNAIMGGFGNQTLDLLPGTYAVVISGKRVEGVTVQSGHDTKVKVGVLRVTAGGGTRIEVLDPATKQALTGGVGNQQIGFPIGQVSVSIAGQAAAVTIQEGKITDF